MIGSSHAREERLKTSCGAAGSHLAEDLWSRSVESRGDKENGADVIAVHCPQDLARLLLAKVRAALAELPELLPRNVLHARATAEGELRRQVTLPEEHPA